MKLYIGTKIIKAEPMDKAHFHLHERGLEEVEVGLDGKGQPGYKVIYPDGYVSWSPKATFENAYREVTEGERKLF